MNIEEIAKRFEAMKSRAEKAETENSRLKEANAAMLEDLKTLFGQFIRSSSYTAADAVNQLLVKYATPEPTCKICNDEGCYPASEGDVGYGGPASYHECGCKEDTP